jgi:uncharacterized protein (TIGR02996 family)
MSAPFTDEDRAFLRGILTNPAELTGWLAYADWLDDRGDPRSEFVRLQVRLSDPALTQTDRFGVIGRLEDIRSNLDPDWLAVFDRPDVENCDERFAFQCPKKWERLRATERAEVRFCEACRQEVRYCHTMREAYDHARQGHCVAVSQVVRRYTGDLEHDPDTPRVARTLGILRMPDPPPAPPRRPWWKFW